jgi:hypothetical protein
MLSDLYDLLDALLSLAGVFPQCIWLVIEAVAVLQEVAGAVV